MQVIYDGRQDNPSLAQPLLQACLVCDVLCIRPVEHFLTFSLNTCILGVHFAELQVKVDFVVDEKPLVVEHIVNQESTVCYANGRYYCIANSALGRMIRELD